MAVQKISRVIYLKISGLSIKRKFIIIFIILLIAVFNAALSECAENNRKIIDSLGREVLIPEKVNKIIALNSALRFICYVNSADIAVAVENIDKNYINTRAYTIAVSGITKNLPVIGEGGVNHSHDIEKIIALKPDVIFEAFNDLKQIETLQKQTNIPVISLCYGDNSWCSEEVFLNSLKIAGAALNRETESAELIKFIGVLNEDLKNRTADIKLRKKAYIGGVSYRGAQAVTSSDSKYMPFIKAGAENVATELSANSHIFLDREKILEWQPEYIFIDAGGMQITADDYAKNKKYYDALKAVNSNKVFGLLPSVFYFINVETLYINAYFIGKTLYPDRFSDVDLPKKSSEIYKAFVNKDCYDIMSKQYNAPGNIIFNGNKLNSKRLY